MTEHAATHHDVVGHEVVADYVVYIVDIWIGDRTDPAVEVVRHTGIWRGSDLEDVEGNAFDPDFSKCTPKTYRYDDWGGGDPEPLMWDSLEIEKKADPRARSHKDEALKWEDPEGYVGYGQNHKKELYIKFLDAIDILADDPENEEAWAMVKDYRDYSAHLHEK
jgi:hypothetical protein